MSRPHPSPATNTRQGGSHHSDPREPLGARPRRPQAPQLSTKEGVLMGETSAWPVPSRQFSVTGRTQKILQMNEVRASHMAPYCGSPAMAPSMAKFLVRLLLTPRAYVGSYRSAIWSSFIGSPAPADTERIYLSGDAGTLNERGSREMAKIHIAAVRRIREQILPSTPMARGPKMPLTAMPACPFGVGCIYQIYAEVFKTMIGQLGGGVASFVKFDIRRHGAAGAEERLPTMVPVTLFPNGCTCPYAHHPDHAPGIEAIRDAILTSIPVEMLSAAWRQANGAPVTAPPQAIDRSSASFISAETVRAAIAALPEADRLARIAFTMIAALDNASDPRLPHQEGDRQEPGVFEDLDMICRKEIEQWKAHTDSGADVPYLAHFDYRALLKLNRPQEAPRNIAVASIMVDLRPPVDDDDDGRPGPVEAPPVPEDPVHVQEEQEPPVSYHGGRHPLHGRRYVPRMVTDDFLDHKGFDFSEYHRLRLRGEGRHEWYEHVDYLYWALVDLYTEYLPGPEGNIQGLAEAVMRRFGADPYMIFDCGHAYIPLYGSET